MPEITKTDSENDKTHWFWIVFFALSVFVYFFGLTIPLVGPDEPRYAQVAREMFERGDWITPTLGGFYWFEKPALLYWLEIAAYHLFGVSEFAARVGPALCGLGTIFSLWCIGRYAGGKSLSGNKNFAHWVALIAASSLGLIVFSRGASFDIVVTFPITAALAGFFIYESASDGSRQWRTFCLFLFYFFIGVAVLAKGLIGVVFPIAIVAFYYVLIRRFPPRSFLLSLFWGFAVTACVAAVWYVPMYLLHGEQFVDEFIIQHHFQRFTSNKYQHPQPFYFFFWVLPLMTIPWLPFLPVAIWTAAKRLLRGKSTSELNNRPPNGKNSHDLRSRLMIFSLAWLVVPLMFFTFSGSKLPGYILPSVPGAVLIIAVYVFDVLIKRPKFARLVKATALATYVIIVSALLLVVPEFAREESVKELAEIANSKGYASAPVVSYLTVSHNAEFYMSGRVVRDQFGKQRRFIGPPDLLEYVREHGNSPVIVLVPLEHLRHLTAIPELDTQVLSDNRELVIAVTRLK